MHAYPMMAVLAVALAARPALADLEATQEARFLIVNPATGDQHGFAVAIDGDSAAVGAPFSDPGGSSKGTVDLYVRNGHDWSLEQVLEGPDGTFPEFGFSVAIQGDVLAVGAPRAQSGAQTVHVFERVGGVWTERAQLQGSDSQSFDRFGSAVALDGDVLVVGAFKANGAGGNDSGKAYVFRTAAPGDVSSWVEEAVLEPASSQQNAQFGAAVDVDGERVIVGAWTDDSAGVDSGAAYLFEYDAGTGSWPGLTKIVPANGSAGDHFGVSVALEGELAVVGANQDDTPAGGDAGSVYLVELEFGFWSITQQFHASDASGADYFGTSLSLSGSRCLVGAPGWNGLGPGTGAAYLFELGGPTAAECDRFGPCDARPQQNFGSAAALSVDRALIGSPRHDGVFTDSGAAYALVFADESFESYGFGDGSLTACPCANETLAGAEMGCANSTGIGAHLDGLGTDEVALDDLLMRGCNLPPSVPALLFAGTIRLLDVPFGDGLRVAGGMSQRLGTQQADAIGGATWGPGLVALGGFQAGNVRHFQIWYRDTFGPCGSGFNLSSGLTVTFE